MQKALQRTQSSENQPIFGTNLNHDDAVFPAIIRKEFPKVKILDYKIGGLLSIWCQNIDAMACFYVLAYYGVLKLTNPRCHLLRQTAQLFISRN
uniref:Uncharacterized protein n=1 Tax=Arundo donax TaxID=35708 RepID=A0A0A9GA94_ARUDO